MATCENCLKGHRLPGTPKGTMVKVGTCNAYLAAAPTPVAEKGKKVIVLFTDMFGLPLGNPQIQADEFASKVGCDVYVPDMFNGSPPAANEDLEPYDHYEIGTPTPLYKKLGFAWVLIKALPNILFGNKPGQVSARMKTFIETLKAEKGYTSIGAVGYCYGGIVIIKLAGSGLFSTAVIAHPGNSTKEEREKINFPTSWILAEEDPAVTPELAKEIESMFASRTGADKVPYEFKTYKGTKHGFAARPPLHIPVIKEAFDDAMERTTAWFKNTL